MMINDTLKAMFHQPWQVLEWWSLGLGHEDQGSLLVEGNDCFVLKDLIWGRGTPLETQLKAGTEWSGFPSVTVEILKTFLPDDIKVFFTHEKGYDLRVCSRHTEIFLHGPDLMVLKAPVLWITGVHPQKGCLYLTASGSVSPEPDGALWTSYHAYPHGDGIVSTRVRNVRQIFCDGEVQEYEDRGEGVYYMGNVRSGLVRFDVETF